MVIDASVLIDIFCKEEKRHSIALKLVELIKHEKIYLPTTAILELRCRFVRDPLGFERVLCNFENINIDSNFIYEYVIPSFPYIKAGDLVYLLIALKKNCPLITEDNFQYEKAKEVGIEVYRIQEYLDNYATERV